jgi:hypothetical protein
VRPSATQKPVALDINRFAAADHIHSVTDAKMLLLALEDAWYQGLVYYDTDNRLAQAEYDAVRDPRKRIPESLILKVANERAQMLWSSNFFKSAEALHQHRIKILAVQLPSLVQNADGSVPDDCRPVEAVLMIEDVDVRTTHHTGVDGKYPALPGGISFDESLRAYLSTHPEETIFAKYTLDELGLK